MKIILAVTGASGSVYAKFFLEKVSLLKDSVEECVLIFSENGLKVLKFELGKDTDFNRFSNIRCVENHEIFDAVASGSAGYQSMVIMPCSMGTLGRIASGTSSDLISRAADVMLKEKRTLIVVPREAPYNSIHLQNMLSLDRAGAHIIPASPFFYHKPQSLDELLLPFVERVMEKAGLESHPFEWGV